MLVSVDDLNLEKPCGFIVLEGVNGSGKSTLLGKLAALIQERGINVICTREPGGTKLGQELRTIVQEGRVGKISEIAELLLFAADRAEHVEKLIKPALQQKSIVISDRYFYSTTAFQGYGRGLDLDLVQRINEYAVRDCLPSLVLLLDLDPAEGLRRNLAGSKSCAAKDTFEAEDLAFHTRIRDGFLKIAQETAVPFVRLDASKTPDAVFLEALPAVEKLLEQFQK